MAHGWLFLLCHGVSFFLPDPMYDFVSGLLKILHFLGMIRMDGGQWTPASRASYNLRDTVARCTVQV